VKSKKYYNQSQEYYIFNMAQAIGEVLYWIGKKFLVRVNSPELTRITVFTAYYSRKT
jgi:hypothetical protein